LNSPAGLALDGAGNLYIADMGNNVIRKVDGKTQVISTVAGGGGASGIDGFGDGGPATSALLSGPSDLAVDGTGNLFIADSYHGLVRKVDAVTGFISVVAGGGTSAGTDGLGDGGPATKAFLVNPSGIALDASGNLFIADTGHAMVRKVDLSSTISVVAGSGRWGYASGVGPALGAPFGSISAIRVDAGGNLYIADKQYNILREVTAVTGLISTVAGTGALAYSGNGGLATQAALANPSALALDSAGNLYMADYTNNVVRKIVPNNTSLSFTNTLVGEISSPQTIAVTNTGNQALAISNIRVSPNFRQVSVAGDDCPATASLAPGAACKLNVQFAPTTAGSPLSGSLILTQNGQNTSQPMQVAIFTGSATASSSLPQISFSPSSLSFAAQQVGTTSAAQVITVTNTGSAPLSFSGVSFGGVNGGEFQQSSTCSAALAAGAKCSISVVFAPASSGSKSASLLVSDLLLSSPQAITITGIAGQPNAKFSTTSVSFFSRALGTSTTQTITIQNSGTAALILSGSPTLTGANGSDFTVSSTCGNTLNTGGTCTLNVAFAPRAAGLRSATITLLDNAGTGTQTVSLSGTGLMPSRPTIWRPSNGTWYYYRGTNTTPTTQQWGLSGDIPVPGDYDGDGITDFAVFRPSTQTWWIINSRTGATTIQVWGIPGDRPVPADYDGDGKTDIAVFRASDCSWWIVYSSTGAGVKINWGLAGDQPVPGDFDGDGRADVAIFRPSDCSWWIISSRTGVGSTQLWGIRGDQPVARDYDGDGKVDIAVFRASDRSWWIIYSSTGAGVKINWGLAGDQPVPGDFDGDGRTDISIFRPSEGNWYVYKSTTGAMYIVPLGTSSDFAVTSFYRP
jgi:hypothetical protein